MLEIKRYDKLTFPLMELWCRARMMRVELSSASQYLLSPFYIPGPVPKVSYAPSHLILTRGLCFRVSISLICKNTPPPNCLSGFVQPLGKCVCCQDTTGTPCRLTRWRQLGEYWAGQQIERDHVAVSGIGLYSIHTPPRVESRPPSCSPNIYMSF